MSSESPGPGTASASPEPFYEEDDDAVETETLERKDSMPDYTEEDDTDRKGNADDECVTGPCSDLLTPCVPLTRRRNSQSTKGSG